MFAIRQGKTLGRRGETPRGQLLPRLLADRLLPQQSIHLRRGTVTHAPAGELLLDFEYFVRRRTHMVSPWSGKVDQRAQLAGEYVASR